MERAEELWRRRIADYRASGLTAREYARRNGFHETTLSRWGRVLAAKSVPPSPTLMLARVRPEVATESPADGPGAEVELVVRGVVVRVRPGFDVDLLRAVVAALTSER